MQKSDNFVYQLKEKSSIQIARMIKFTSEIKMIEIPLFIVFIVNYRIYPFDA